MTDSISNPFGGEDNKDNKDVNADDDFPKAE